MNASPWARQTLGFAPGAAAIVLWALSLASIPVAGLNDYGLSDRLPLLWWLALGLAVAGAVAGILLRRPVVAGCHIGAVVIICFCTIPAISGVPQYTWTYKHTGVVDYILQNGSVDPGIDIYHRWPGFFALAAAFGEVTGLHDPITYAAWAEPAFTGLDAVLLAGVMRAVSRDAAVAGLAALLFVLGNWVGQSYFAPQALSFTLTLALALVVLRDLSGAQDTGLGPWVGRVLERISRRPQLEPSEPATGWRRPVAIGVALALLVVIVPTHQLTPYVITITLVGLAAIGALRPRWLAVAVGVLTVAYLIPNLGFVKDNFGLFTSFDPFDNSRSALAGLPHAAGKIQNAWLSRALALLLWAGGGLGLLALARRGLGRRALPLVAFALAPFAILFGQSYGGEAVLRVILFSLPWAAGLAAWAIATTPSVPLRGALTGGLSLVAAALFVPAFFGQSQINIVPRGEVTASRWFYAHAPKNSLLLLAGPNFPVRLTGDYNDFRGQGSGADSSLLSDPAFGGARLPGVTAAQVAAKLRGLAVQPYLVFAAGEVAYARAYGLAPPGALAALEAKVDRSPFFTRVYDSPTTRIYRLKAFTS